MIKEITATGATIEEAIENAKAALAAPEDAQVNVDIIELPKKKLFGLFGGSPAKAKAYYEVPDAPKPKAPGKKPVQPKPIQPKPVQPKPIAKPVQDKKQTEKPKPEPKAQKAKPEPKREFEPKNEPEVKAQDAPTPEEIGKEVAISSNKCLQLAADYLEKVVKGMGIEQLELKAFETGENEYVIELGCGDDYGVIIGRRGETLDALQYLTRLAANKCKDDDDFSRISINVGNYREKRNETLVRLAQRNAERVIKYGKNFTFEAMNPYERRVIHTAVQEIKGVTSYSIGSDADRRVVIALAPGYKPTHQGGYSKSRQSGSRSRSSGKGGRGKQDQTVQSPQRAPKTDVGAQGVSLYGKIN